jgi:hypothetical protein
MPETRIGIFECEIQICISLFAAFFVAQIKNTVVGDAFEHTDLRDAAVAPLAVMDRVCVPKTKSESIDDEARPRWRAKLWRRIAEPAENSAYLCLESDVF